MRLSDAVFEELLTVDPADWAEAVADQQEFLNSFGARMPDAIWDEHSRLARAIEEAATPADLRGRDLGE